jgi:hypothetical protein
MARPVPCAEDRRRPRVSGRAYEVKRHMSSPRSPDGLNDMVQQHDVAHDDRNVRSTVLCSGRVAPDNIRGQSCARNPQAGSAAQRRNHGVRRKSYTILHLAIADEVGTAAQLRRFETRTPPIGSVSRSHSVSRGAPNDRAGSLDAVLVTKVGPPTTITSDDVRGRLRPPRAEALLVRGRRSAELVVDKNQPGRRRLFRGEPLALQQSCDAQRGDAPLCS